ncbi:lipoprotein [Streptomyces sp. NPDC002644]
MRRAVTGTAVCAVVLAGLVGCGSGGDGRTAEASGRAEASSGGKARSAEVAKSGGTVGPAGSPCELPVSFDTAAGWKAEEVTDPERALEDMPEDMKELGLDDVARELVRQGPVTAACEVDGDGAGHLGFLRVWTADPSGDDATTVLKAFVDAETEGAEKARYGTFGTGDGLRAAEVEYLTMSVLWEELVPRRALALVTPDGPVVVHLGGTDEQEHEAMLPAYELARTTLHTT